MPVSSAVRMAAIESLPSWVPQANAQPEPPIAQAPKPIGVMCRSVVPSCLVSMIVVSFIPVPFTFRTLHDDDVEPGGASILPSTQESCQIGQLWCISAIPPAFRLFCDCPKQEAPCCLFWHYLCGHF